MAQSRKATNVRHYTKQKLNPWTFDSNAKFKTCQSLISKVAKRKFELRSSFCGCECKKKSYWWVSVAGTSYNKCIWLHPIGLECAVLMRESEIPNGSDHELQMSNPPLCQEAVTEASIWLCTPTMNTHLFSELLLLITPCQPLKNERPRGVRKCMKCACSL